MLKKKSYNQSVQEQLWSRFKEGDPIAFQQIYDQYIDVLLAYGSKITSDRELLKDCIHDLFISLYKYCKRINEYEYIEFYLFKSLKRILVKQISKERLKESLTDHADLLFNLNFNFEEDYIRKETEDHRYEKLKEAFSTLDPQKQELIFLRFYSGLSYAEIGEVVGLQTEAVKKQVYRTFDYLRDKCPSILVEMFIMCCKA